VWRYVYRAVDQHGQIIDVLISPPRRERGPSILSPGVRDVEGDADRGSHDAAPVYPRVLDDLVRLMDGRAGVRSS
jgi:transposase-like protein